MRCGRLAIAAGGLLAVFLGALWLTWDEGPPGTDGSGAVRSPDPVRTPAPAQEPEGTGGLDSRGLSEARLLTHTLLEFCARQAGPHGVAAKRALIQTRISDPEVPPDVRALYQRTLAENTENFVEAGCRWWYTSHP